MNPAPDGPSPDPHEVADRSSRCGDHGRCWRGRHRRPRPSRSRRSPRPAMRRPPGRRRGATPRLRRRGLAPIPATASAAVRVPILMYRRVADPRPIRTASERTLNVPPRDFTAQMNWLTAQGYTTITPSQLYEALADGTPLPREPVLLTFDDGCVEMSTTVLPILRRRKTVATADIITSRVTHPDRAFMTFESAEADRRRRHRGRFTRPHPSGSHIAVGYRPPRRAPPIPASPGEGPGSPGPVAQLSGGPPRCAGRGDGARGRLCDGGHHGSGRHAECGAPVCADAREGEQDDGRGGREGGPGRLSHRQETAGH